MKDVHRGNMRKSIWGKKNTCFLIGLLFVCCLLMGCGKKEDEIVEITFIHGWGNAEADHEAMRQIYKDFEKEHPEIRLNMISMPAAEDVVSKMGDLLAVGKIPDIVFTAGDGRETIYEYMVQKGYALDLMPYIEEDQAFCKNISPAVLNYWKTKNGELYTVSDVCMMVGYWYNVDLFSRAGISEPPATWEAWEEACRKLKRSDLQISPFVLDTDHIVYLTNVILHEEELSQIENIQNDTIHIESNGFQRTLKRLKEFSEYTDTINAYSFRDSLDAFNKGKTAIYLNGVWANSMIEEDLNVAYAAFPTEDGSGVAMLSSGVGYILGNTGDAKRMNASVEFLKYMLSEPVAERILKETGQVPSNPNLEIAGQPGNERFYQAVSCMKNARNVIEVPANLWSLKLQEAYAANLILYLEDKITMEEMQKNLDELFPIMR